MGYRNWFDFVVSNCWWIGYFKSIKGIVLRLKGALIPSLNKVLFMQVGPWRRTVNLKFYIFQCKAPDYEEEN